MEEHFTDEILEIQIKQFLLSQDSNTTASTKGTKKTFKGNDNWLAIPVPLHSRGYSTDDSYESNILYMVSVPYYHLTRYILNQFTMDILIGTVRHKVPGSI